MVGTRGGQFQVQNHDAKSLLKMGRDVASITPTEFVTDGLPAYHDFNKVFQSKKNKDKVKHTNEIHIRHQKKPILECDKFDRPLSVQFYLFPCRFFTIFKFSVMPF